MQGILDEGLATSGFRAFRTCNEFRRRFDAIHDIVNAARGIPLDRALSDDTFVSYAAAVMKQEHDCDRKTREQML
jgi:hypothetical protein